MEKIYRFLKSGPFIILMSCFLSFSVLAQKAEYLKEFSFIHPNKKRSTISFELVNNLIIIPVKINGSDTLRFVLDTGVAHTMLTSLDGGQEISLESSRRVEIYGLGKGESIEAIHSTGNSIQIGDAKAINMDILIPVVDVFRLSYNLGIPVNGLIGYDFFKSFVVEIDYTHRKIQLHDPVHFHKKLNKYEHLPIFLEKKKPYVNVAVRNEEHDKVPVKLLIDSGASHALSLYDQGAKLTVPKNSLYSYLGTGLSGDLHGHIGRIGSLELGKHILNEPVVSFPENSSVQIALDVSDRNGSLGSDVLKRFHTIFDYQNGFVYLRPNGKFKESFKYNLSGLALGTPFPGLPIYEITQVRSNSPAGQAGLEKGDQIVNVNGVKVNNLSLNEIIELLQSKPGKSMRISVKRDNEYVVAKFKLKDPI